MTEITNQTDIIDSRDMIDQIEALKFRCLEPEDNDFYEEDSIELGELLYVQNQCEDITDWKYGEALVRASYFTDYIKGLIDDCYDIPKEIKSGDWPWRHMKIDYEAAAEEAKIDYTEIDFNGITYYIRS